MSPGLTIGVFGDIGDTINSTMTLGHLAANSPQIILNVGDLVCVSETSLLSCCIARAKTCPSSLPAVHTRQQLLRHQTMCCQGVATHQTQSDAQMKTHSMLTPAPVQTYADKHAPALYYGDDESTGALCFRRML